MIIVVHHCLLVIMAMSKIIPISNPNRHVNNCLPSLDFWFVLFSLLINYITASKTLLDNQNLPLLMRSSFFENAIF